MGHNIDFKEFGMSAIRCKDCGSNLEVEEVDIDCDLSTEKDMSFILSIYCNHCEETKDVEFKLVEVKQ